ncbi:MAG TPA: sugar ABC transporter ATP-binding protein [Phycisphaerae bacterium]
MKRVSKRFGATVALDSVDLEVRTGEVHALIGENGAGKSTLMKILAGAYQPDAGQLWLDGQPYRPRSPADGRRAGVAMIYQELSLAPHLSVMGNILLGVEPTRGPLLRARAGRRRAADALRQVGHPDLPLDVPVGRLSTAEQQLVEIARSVATGCRVLVFDEPTSSLARDDIQRLFGLIRRLKVDGHAIVYISHALEEVQEISDRFTVLRDGRAVRSGPTAGAKLGDIVALMVGRTVDELYPRSCRAPGEVILELNELAGVRLPASASLELRRGEVLGIAGLIGAGRSELVRAVFGLERVRRGQIKIAHYAGPAAPSRRWAQGVGLVSEDRAREGLALNLSVAENLTMPRPRGWLGLTWPTAQQRAARPWIERLPIRCLSASQPVRTLSGGNQQKVALARLLHADVDVLLLDEPTRGIDVGSKAQIYQLIDGLTLGEAGQSAGVACFHAQRVSPPRADRPAADMPGSAMATRLKPRSHGTHATLPKAVLMISSYLPELLGMCDRIAVMYRGRLGPARPVSQLDEHRIMLEATGVQSRSGALGSASGDTG